MNCPYNFKTTDPGFCNKCQRCTPEGFNDFIHGEKRNFEFKKICRKKRSGKGENPYSRFYIEKKKGGI